MICPMSKNKLSIEHVGAGVRLGDDGFFAVGGYVGEAFGNMSARGQNYSGDSPAPGRESAHVAAVKRAYVFRASLNRADAAQQLTRSAKLAFSDILLLCHDQCVNGFTADCWMHTWLRPRHYSVSPCLR